MSTIGFPPWSGPARRAQRVPPHFAGGEEGTEGEEGGREAEAQDGQEARDDRPTAGSER